MSFTSMNPPHDPNDSCKYCATRGGGRGCPYSSEPATCEYCITRGCRGCQYNIPEPVVCSKKCRLSVCGPECRIFKLKLFLQEKEKEEMSQPICETCSDRGCVCVELANLREFQQRYLDSVVKMPVKEENLTNYFGPRIYLEKARKPRSDKGKPRVKKSS